MIRPAVASSLALSLVMLTAIAEHARAQTSTQQVTQEKKSPAETVPGDVDGGFITNSWLDGMAEVELGNLATDHAADPRVKEFAQRMVVDHTKANGELGAIAKGRQMALPTQLDGTHAALKRKLTGMKGPAFDREYMNQMVDNHKLAVRSFQAEADGGQDAAVKGFAQKTLPTLKDHLRMAEDIQHAVNSPGSND